MRLEVKLLLVRRGPCLALHLISKGGVWLRRLPFEGYWMISAVSTCQNQGSIRGTEIWRSLCLLISVSEVGTHVYYLHGRV